MIGYLKEIADAIISAPDTPKPGNDEVNLFELAKALSEELSRLDPRDFRPDVRFTFIRCRVDAQSWAQMTSMRQPAKLKILAKDVGAFVDKYGWPRTPSSVRSFRWLSSSDLKDIIVRDYSELSTSLLPDRAWKSTVVMAGSILEAILVDLLIQDPTRLAGAKASKKAPKDKHGNQKHEDDWTLHNLIEIAIDIGLIPIDRGKTFDQVLRDYRNFVHPRKVPPRSAPSGHFGQFMIADDGPSRLPCVDKHSFAPRVKRESNDSLIADRNADRIPRCSSLHRATSE